MFFDIEYCIKKKISSYCFLKCNFCSKIFFQKLNIFLKINFVFKN
jgi:hypothetical protein